MNVPHYNRLLPAALLLCLALALAAAACAEPETTDCPDGAEEWVEHRVFMGRGDGDVEVVGDEAWDAFLADVVTPRFPDGLTVLDASGQWRNSEGSIERERSKVLLIMAPPEADALRLINEISDEYKQRFNQEAVLQAVTDACVSFY